MKSKGGSLYEVLKSASKSGGADGAPTSPEPPTTPAGEGSQPTLQERLAAYKAAKLAAANQPASTPVEPPPARVTSTTLVLEPDPTPLPAPAIRRESPVFALPPAAAVPTRMAEQAVAEAEEAAGPVKGPGERVVRLTYNTVLFAGLITVGLLFISYAVGLHVGKANAAAESVEVTRAAAPPSVAAQPPVTVRPPLPVAPTPPLKKEYSIRLGEWKTATAQDRVKALALADDPDLKKALERAGHKGLQKEFVSRGPNDVRMALYVDRFSDLNSESAKAALTAMKAFKFKNTTPFDKAVFEEMQSK